MLIQMGFQSLLVQVKPAMTAADHHIAQFAQEVELQEQMGQWDHH